MNGKTRDLKWFAKQPVKLMSGHKTCQGCGIPIIVRFVMAASEKPLVTAQGTGCISVTTPTWPYTSWKVPTIHNAFACLASTISGAETAYRALKKKGIVKKELNFVGFGGDGGSYDIGLQALSGALERKHNLVYVCYDNQAYMNCLSLDTLIMTGDGLKKITEVKEGDKVYAFNQKTHEPVLKECTGIFNNGTHEIYALNTLHHSIKATPNHPFLVVKHNGRAKTNLLEWKTVAELRKGDELIVLKQLNNGKSFKFNPIKKSKKGDYKVNRLNEVNLPATSSPDLMRFLGLYVGDGWIRKERGELGFALPKGKKGRKALLEIQEKLFGFKAKDNDEVYIYLNSVNLAKFIDALGFKQGAKNKTIPAWVFTLPENEKQAFIKGLMLSDGYKIGNSSRYVSASFELLKRLRLLLQTMKYRVGKIHELTKKKGSICVKRKLLKDSKCWYVCFSTRNKWNAKKYPAQYKYQNFLINNESFDVEKVKEIKLVSVEPVLDLRVEGEHNFIADGIVVHNTGNQRSSATQKGTATTTTPEGLVHHGKELFRKDLTEIVAAHDIPYVAQSAIYPYGDLINKAVKAFEVKGPAFINALSPCTLFWGIDTGLAYHISKLAVETCYWPLYEVENGKYKLSFKPKEKLPVEEFLKPQKRFKHLLKPENNYIVKELQEHIDRKWNALLKKCNEK